jgi:predicted PurR-regulated permease PerM
MTSTSWDLRSIWAYPSAAFILLAVIAGCLFVFLVPVMRVLRRTGHNPAWSLFAVFPGLNIIMLWIFAFKSWPRVEKS